ncbi:hypothetical protein NDU88_001659 [Pleurodeles waltl]|uniref:Uncharacterized protein n=1 Tax=Pleurodeles waltl TaxID=8319 RepID=A0AAV7P4H9_PLEWA|nr:hypothetical protein NDU88_001659 [Pleurodeles waltl]
MPLAACHGPTDTASTQQYHRGTIASGLPKPAAAAAAPARTPRKAAQEEERDVHPGEVRCTVRVSTFKADSWPHKWNTMTAVSSPIQRPEDQEATTPENRPCSGESVALAGTVLQRTRV